MSKFTFLRILNEGLFVGIVVGSAVITFYACGSAMAQGEDERRRDSFNLSVMNQFQEPSMNQVTLDKLHLQDFVAHEVEGQKAVSQDQQVKEFEVNPQKEVGALLAKIYFEKQIRVFPKELVLGPYGLEGAQVLVAEVILNE